MTLKGINKHFQLYIGGLAAIALELGAPGAVAQELHNHDICHRVAFLPPDPLGDRDGHSLGMTQDNCETVEGVARSSLEQLFHVGMGWDKGERASGLWRGA